MNPGQLEKKASFAPPCSVRRLLICDVRYNDFVLTDPLTMSVSWRLHLLQGYVLRTAPSDTTIRVVQGMSAVLKCTRVDDGMRMQADLVFSESVIPADNFPHMIKALDGLLSSCEQAIVFAKK